MITSISFTKNKISTTHPVCVLILLFMSTNAKYVAYHYQWYKLILILKALELTQDCFIVDDILF